MKNKRLLILLSVLLVIFTLFTAGCNNSADKSSSVSENKAIEVTVVFADKTEKEYEIETDAEYLGEALFENGITTEEEYKSSDGLYTVIAGERADYNKDKSWWCLTKGGETVMVGINQQPIQDGDSFEFTNTPA